MTRLPKIKKVFFVMTLLVALTISLNGSHVIRAESPSCNTAFKRCLQDAQVLDDLGKTGEMVEMVLFCTYGYIWCLIFVE
ncbi:hypothetical protein ACFL6A_00330 [bacterium]